MRPGEIGFATDSRQIYIGADTTDAVSDIYNKTGNFEKTASAQSTTASLANVQMIKFIVPHKVYDKGEFDGVTDSVSWTPATNVAASSEANEYGRLGRVFTNIASTADFQNNITGNVFVPADLTVLKNGTVLSPSNVATIASGNDYFSHRQVLYPCRIIPTRSHLEHLQVVLMKFQHHTMPTQQLSKL